MSRKQAKKKKKKGTSSQNTLKGVLDITRSGIGYVIVENLPNDILVRPNDFNTALHGDTVRVQVFGGAAKKKAVASKGPLLMYCNENKRSSLVRSRSAKMPPFLPQIPKSLCRISLFPKRH